MCLQLQNDLLDVYWLDFDWLDLDNTNWWQTKPTNQHCPHWSHAALKAVLTHEHARFATTHNETTSKYTMLKYAILSHFLIATQMGMQASTRWHYWDKEISFLSGQWTPLFSTLYITSLLGFIAFSLVACFRQSLFISGKQPAWLMIPLLVNYCLFLVPSGIILAYPLFLDYIHVDSIASTFLLCTWLTWNACWPTSFSRKWLSLAETGDISLDVTSPWWMPFRTILHIFTIVTALGSIGRVALSMNISLTVATAVQVAYILSRALFIALAAYSIPSIGRLNQSNQTMRPFSIAALILHCGAHVFNAINGSKELAYYFEDSVFNACWYVVALLLLRQEQPKTGLLSSALLK